MQHLPTSATCGLLLLVLAGNFVMGQELQLVYQDQTQTLQSIEIDSQDYFPLEQIAAILELILEPHGDRLLIHGPRSTLELIDGRSLVRSRHEYHLLSHPVTRRANRWLVPTDFIERALPRVLDSPVRLLPFSDPGARPQVSVQVLNSPSRVSLVFLPSTRGVQLQVEESDRALHVRSDQNVQFLEPLVKPEPSLVSSLRCLASGERATCEIVKGLDFRRHRSRELRDPERLLVDIYSTAVGVFDASKTGLPASGDVAGTVITIDPGHGGEEPGVTARGVLEKDLTAQICRRLRAELEAHQLVTDSTRSSDFNPSLRHRSSVANGNQSTVFLSLHLGGSFSQHIHGPVVFTHRPEADDSIKKGRLKPWHRGQSSFAPQSRRLAALIQERLNRLFGTNTQPATAPLELLAPVEAPAVLIEAGYLTNPKDAESLVKPDFQKAIAASIADAVAVFLR